MKKLQNPTKDVYLWVKFRGMKQVDYKAQDTSLSKMMAAEPQEMYTTEVAVNRFSSFQFQKLIELYSCSQAEWAAILNISLKTLQRYLKDNTPFEGLQAEHLLQLKRLSEIGISVFGNKDAFNAWLKSEKMVLGKSLNLSALQSFWGTRLLEDEIGRIAHGVYS